MKPEEENILKAFFKAEKSDYSGRHDDDLDKSLKEILKLVKKHKPGYLIVHRYTNLGLLKGSITLDTWVDKNIIANRTLKVHLCACGVNYSSTLSQPDKKTKILRK